MPPSCVNFPAIDDAVEEPAAILARALEMRQYCRTEEEFLERLFLGVF